ncbi:MAG: efflux RND transporter periplasmic adaptor subunit [Betaproteobacteria bacterium]|nr:efflux RND transporter periplasmic adaptor subunit [Betaproteobacteria bacterium]
MKRLRNASPLMIGAAVAVGVLAIVLVLHLRSDPVDSIEVQPAPLVQSVLVSGRMANQSRVFLGSTITGRVREVRVREGARVKSGELLVALEDFEQRAAAAQAEAAARSAESRLDSQRQLLGPVAAQQLAQARATASTAQRERERSESLFKQGFIGQARLDEARRAADVADAQLKAAEAQAEANLKGSELEGSVARVAEARAAADLARARLQQTRIVAPADALVLERLVEPGQIVQAGSRLVELSIEGAVELVAQVDEKFLGQLAPGQPAAVVADAFPGTPFTAKVKSVAPVVDAQRGSVEVKLEMDQVPPFLRNDMTLSIEIETARRDRVMAVPGEALRGSGPASQVLVIEDGKAVARTVKPGLRTLTAVEIVEGLKAGERVVTDARVQPGARVRAGAPRAASATSNVSTDVVKSFSRE